MSRRLFQLQVGLLIFGLAVALLIEARIGLDPWSCFQEGLSVRSGLSFGRISQLIGLGLVLLAWRGLRQPPGIGTVCDMLLVGPWIDLFRSLAAFPRQMSVGPGLLQFLVGLLLLALASGLYIGARLGAGPRDALVLGLSRVTGIGIARTRIAIEGLLLVVGFALGGPVGLGTVVFAVMMGPLMQGALGLVGFRTSASQAGV